MTPRKVIKAFLIRDKHNKKIATIAHAKKFKYSNKKTKSTYACASLARLVLQLTLVKQMIYRSLMQRCKLNLITVTEG